ncbi:AMP-binding protein [Thaumasiovibrio sp. DFM-14]|uniref:AMP-binding protein n=1 Tax=Thaumasiovibrio sp. DFM-14 TaxID=3384792 RepID=UPI0039A3B24A
MTNTMPWLQSYPSNVSAEINADEFDSILALLEQSCAKYANYTAFINMGKKLSYNELDTHATAFAAYLQQTLKMKKGDRIALMMPNLLQYPIALFGALKAGLVVVNVNPLYTARELQHQLHDSGATAIVAVTNFGNTLQKVINDTKVQHVILTNIGDQLAPHKRTVVNFVVKHIKKMVPNYHLPNAISMRRVLTEGKQLNYQRPQLRAEDSAFLQYTGGTTGTAKGAVLSHRNIVANVLQVFAHFGPRTLKEKERAVTPLPLYHIFANTVSMMLFMYMGGCNMLITNPRDLDAFAKDLKGYPFTMMFGLNTLFVGLLKHEGFRHADFSHCRFTIAGGMATQKSVADEWQAVTNMPVIEGYGLTECSPVVAGGLNTQQAFVDNIGVPLPSTQMRIVDEKGNPVATGETGEIQIRGPQVMQGYWKNELETRECLSPDGWLSSGDIGSMDEKGYFTIRDRKKDMILVSGFNVYPSEIEAVALLHPSILEAAAIGIHDEVAGERVALFVVGLEDLTQEEIRQHCRQHLTGYKVPKAVTFCDSLPKSNVGKVLRRELKAQYAPDS